VAPSCVPLQVQELDTATNTGRLGETLGTHDEIQPGCFGGMLTVRRLRRLSRRRFKTCRPPGVPMRARKPCVRFRRRLLG
jgi:hypothetical protein